MEISFEAYCVLQGAILIWFPIISIGIINLFLLANNSNLPTFEELEKEIPTNLATQILSSDGEVLGTFFKENRTNVEYNEQKQAINIINALISTEDERYYNHAGIDFKSLRLGRQFLVKNRVQLLNNLQKCCCFLKDQNQS